MIFLILLVLALALCGINATFTARRRWEINADLTLTHMDWKQRGWNTDLLPPVGILS